MGREKFKRDGERQGELKIRGGGGQDEGQDKMAAKQDCMVVRGLDGGGWRVAEKKTEGGRGG